MNLKVLYTIAVAIALVKLTIPLPFVPDITMAWVVLAVLCLVLVLLRDWQFKISQPLLFFCLFALLGLVIVDPPAYFRSFERFLAFVLGLAVLSPLLVSESLNKVRVMLFKVTMIGLRLVVIASFIAYLLGINLATELSTDVYWGFGGITNQSMVLAPISVICFLETAHRLLYIEMPVKKRWTWVALLIMSLWLIFVAGSRGALAGCLCAVLLLLYYHKKIKKFILVYLVAVGMGAAALPQSIYDAALYSINRKQESAVRKNSWFSSREEKWSARWTEFTESPVFGVGFAAQTHFTDDDDLEYIQETGGLEPGASWLCVLSMTGLLGFACLFTLNFNLFRGVMRRCRDDVESILFISLMLFFFMHGCIEGWIFYAGGYIFYLYWLLTGIMHIKAGGGSVQELKAVTEF